MVGRSQKYTPRKKATNILKHINILVLRVWKRTFALLGFLRPRYIAPQKALLQDDYCIPFPKGRYVRENPGVHGT